MGTFWEHLESKTASHVRERRFLYPDPVQAIEIIGK